MASLAPLVYIFLGTLTIVLLFACFWLPYNLGPILTAMWRQVQLRLKPSKLFTHDAEGHVYGTCWACEEMHTLNKELLCDECAALRRLFKEEHEAMLEEMRKQGL